MQVLVHIGLRIASLHDAGFAHRDLKPGNLMWQQRTFNWVLIDFGLAAKLGEEARLGFTPPYAAPETIQALKNHQTRVIVDKSVDLWALGIMAFELLLERSPYGVIPDIDEVLNPCETYNSSVTYKCSGHLCELIKCVLPHHTGSILWQP